MIAPVLVHIAVHSLCVCLACQQGAFFDPFDMGLAWHSTMLIAGYQDSLP